MELDTLMKLGKSPRAAARLPRDRFGGIADPDFIKRGDTISKWRP